jgi:hypothetical protein
MIGGWGVGISVESNVKASRDCSIEGKRGPGVSLGVAVSE